jgi:hypothetical protein
MHSLVIATSWIDAYGYAMHENYWFQGLGYY